MGEHAHSSLRAQLGLALLCLLSHSVVYLPLWRKLESLLSSDGLSRRSQHSPNVWLCPVSKPQQTGRPQNVHELHLRGCCLHRSQHSCADAVRYESPQVSNAPSRPECGCSPHEASVVTGGQALFAGWHLPSWQAMASCAVQG